MAKALQPYVGFTIAFNEKNLSQEQNIPHLLNVNRQWPEVSHVVRN